MQHKESRYYRFGTLLVRLDGPAFSESDYLLPFRAAAGSPDLHFCVEMVEQIAPPTQPERRLTPYETICGAERVIYDERSGEILLKDTDLSGGYHHVLFRSACLSYYGSHLVLRLMDLPRRVMDYGGVFLHASYIAVDGKAILFTAPKQVGKSTQAALWEAHRQARVINGDRALLQKIDGVWCACGSPYCGTSKICRSESHPIKAIVILTQAKENRIHRATPREALSAFLDGCSYDVQDQRQVNTVMTVADELIQQGCVMHLACLPDESAVQTLEEFL